MLIWIVFLKLNFINDVSNNENSLNGSIILFCFCLKRKTLNHEAWTAASFEQFSTKSSLKVTYLACPFEEQKIFANKAYSIVRIRVRNFNYNQK